MHEAFEKNPDLKVRSSERIDYAADLVVGNAQRADVVRADLQGADLMQLLGPMCTNATLTWEQGQRPLGVILDGLRVTT